MFDCQFSLLELLVVVFDWLKDDRYYNSILKLISEDWVQREVRIICIVQFESNIILDYKVLISQMYRDMEQPEQDSNFAKIRRSLYLIVSISLLTHTISVTYSVMSFREQSVGFISIIVSSLVCFFISSSHLTIYGISILGCLYLSMLRPYYEMRQLCYIVALSGAINFPLWKMIHSIGSIFRCLPGRIHASMVFGISLIVLSKFLPLAIENIKAFFLASDQTPLTNPLEIIRLTFATFNVLTLGLSVGCIFLMFLLRERLSQIPLIAILVLIGIGINWTKNFASFQDLCSFKGDDGTFNVDCTFYILNVKNLIQPKIQQILEVLPASLVMTVILIFEQFLYLEEFERRGKRYNGGGNLGDIKTQSKVLAVANIVSGCLGGLPVCINMFATYQSFAFNQKYGFKGTKLVGLMQIPVSYCLYSFLSFLYERIPLFILFIIIATPAIYFVKNMLSIHSKNLPMIIFIAALNVITHPVIALIFAAIVSIYDIAELLKPSPAQILVEGVYVEGQRQSTTFAKVVEKQAKEENEFITQFVTQIKEIQDDIPAQLDNKAYILYRFVGTVSYLNYSENLSQIRNIAERHCYGKNQTNKPILVLSFRYAQIIDNEAMEELSYLVKQLKNMSVTIIFTGLHQTLLLQMKNGTYFAQLMEKQPDTLYSLHVQ